MSDDERRGAPGWLRLRRYVQVAAALIANARFLLDLRGVCFPGLNCWACPTAGFACPMGALQHGMAMLRVAVVVPLYVLGTILALSALMGRSMCGWLCPFGLVQDLLGRIRRSHWRLPRWTGYLKYVVLVVLGLVIPYLTLQLWFCKVCPQGALQGGILQPLVQPKLQAQIGTLWAIKIAILVVVLVASVLVRRPFCATACPLGALFSLGSRVSLVRLEYDRDACTDCMWCVRACPAGIDPRVDLNSNMCVSCMECAKCPFDAIHVTTALRRRAEGGEAEPAAKDEVGSEEMDEEAEP